MTTLRIIIGLLIAAAIAVALIPLWVLLDLHEGGSGWGLCADGLNTCRNGYFSGFEMLGTVTLALFVILMMIALCVRIMRVMERRRRNKTGAFQQ